MAALRGPDSSEDERRLGEQAVFPETVDVNIRQLDPIPAPRAFLREQPLTDEMSELVLHSRQEIRDVLNGRDDRLLVIVGPCSIHDPKAAHELKLMMREHCDAGGAIFFSTHVLEVAEKLCDKVAIIKSGRLIASGSMEEVKGDSSLENVFLELEGEEC